VFAIWDALNEPSSDQSIENITDILELHTRVVLDFSADHWLGKTYRSNNRRFPPTESDRTHDFEKAASIPVETCLTTRLNRQIPAPAPARDLDPDLDPDLSQREVDSSTNCSGGLRRPKRSTFNMQRPTLNG
jgi:hypothetical protein